MNSVKEPEIIEKYYKIQSKIYDSTRWTFLFGRKPLTNRIIREIKPKDKVIELGCGTGYNLENIEKKAKCDLFGLDLSDDMLNIASKKLSSTKLLNKEYNFEAFEENTFDLILMSYFITLNSNKKPILESVYKHLKPGGKIAIVDFHAANYDFYNKFMLKNHIHIDPKMLDNFQDLFKTKYKRIKKGYLGIWDWFMYIGEKQVGN